MKDLQRISRHDPWPKIPQMTQKTLTQTKMFISGKPDERGFYGFREHQRYSHEL